jgi:hypothetical protein
MRLSRQLLLNFDGAALSLSLSSEEEEEEEEDEDDDGADDGSEDDEDDDKDDDDDALELLRFPRLSWGGVS